ncbi:MAG: hypothetical protein LBG28_01710 [Tannerella sp.]|nr:hypothetical protein [Tannerella sp.]
MSCILNYLFGISQNVFSSPSALNKSSSRLCVCDYFIYADFMGVNKRRVIFAKVISALAKNA